VRNTILDGRANEILFSSVRELKNYSKTNKRARFERFLSKLVVNNVHMPNRLRGLLSRKSPLERVEELRNRTVQY